MFTNIYYDEYKGKMHLWEINQTTKKVNHIVEDHEVEYYIKDDTNTSKIRDIYGTRVVKRVADSRKSLRELRKSNVETFESDISEEVKFLHKRYKDIDFKPNPKDYKIANIDIEIQCANEFPKPELAKYPINLITVDFYRTDEIVTLGLNEYHGQLLNKPGFRYIYCESEEILLTKFCELIKKEKTQAITGWNIGGFDIPYICNRIENLGIQDQACLSYLGRVIKKRNGTYQIPGLALLDLMELYKKFSYQNQPSYSLNYIGLQEVGEGKLDFEGQINDLWDRDWDLFVDYNVQDTALVRKIEFKRKFVDLVINLCTQTRTPFERVYSTISIVEGYMLRYLHRENMVFPDLPLRDYDSDEEEEDSIEGGYVESHPGYYRKEISIDAESLYPSIMRMFNISPETKIIGDMIRADHIHSVNPNVGYSQIQGVLPKIVSDIFFERKKFKNMMFEAEQAGDKELAEYMDSQQMIRKILINCFHKNTDIVTCDGIKKIKDVKTGDYVFSINQKTKEVEKKKVLDIVSKHYTGNLIKFEHDRVKLRVTPDHDMLSCDNDGSIIKIKAKDLLGKSRYNSPKHVRNTNDVYEEYIYLSDYVNKEEYYFILNKDIDTRHSKKEIDNEFGQNYINITNLSRGDRKRYKFIDRKLNSNDIDRLETLGYTTLIRHIRDQKCSMIKSKVLNKDFSSYVGWYLAEGCATTSKLRKFENTTRGISNGISISQYKLVNPEYYKEIEELHQRLFTKYHSGNRGISVSNDAIYHVITTNFGSLFTKRIYKTELGRKLIPQELFNSMYKGDGNKRDFRYTITKKNETFMNDFVMLMVQLGEFPRVNSNENGDTASYRITRRNATAFTKENITEESYDDMVYCINVEDNHTVLVGEDGTFMWSGQCMYGVLCNRFFHFYDLDNAANVTGHGREVIQYISNCINDYFCNHFYKIAHKYYPNHKLEVNSVPKRIVFVNDTDSGYIWFEHIYNLTNSGESFLDWTLNFEKIILQPFLTKCMEIYANRYNTKNLINFKREKIILKQYVQGKKKYATQIIANEKIIYDKPVLKVTGIEINRSDLCGYSRKKLKKLLDIMMAGDEYAYPNKDDMLEYIRSAYREFKSQSIQDISAPKGINGYNKYNVVLDETFSNFKPHTPMHNKASMIYNFIIKKEHLPYMEINDGTKMKYVFVNPRNKYKTNVIGYVGNYPKEFQKIFKIDYDEQFEKQFKAIGQRMFDVLDFGEITLKDSKIMSFIEEE